MEHIFLSPHADDAVLSCGGLIADLVKADESVVVLTVMMGRVPPNIPLSPFIEDHFVRWQIGHDPVAGRKLEDEMAIGSLGAHVRFGDIPDALYRADGRGRWLYPSLEALFGAVHPDDPAPGAVSTILEGVKTPQTIYAPLGAGHHVDHVIVRNVALDWYRSRGEVAFLLYEEYPYNVGGAAVVRRARAELAHQTSPQVYALSESAMDAKIAAIALYRSQISTFWVDIPAMERSVKHDAALTGGGSYAERYWRVTFNRPADSFVRDEET